MARYFYGNSESQGGGDGLQTLILMNPAYAGYSDPQPPPPPQQQSTPNFVVVNSNNSENAFNFPHAPPSQIQHLIGIPLEGSNRGSQHQDVSAFHGFLPRVQYGLYNPNTDMVATREGTLSQQGLSLSLSSSQQPPPGYGSFLPERELAPPQPLESPPPASDSSPMGSPASQGGGVQNGVTSVMLSSKYLKAAQELLDEVVNVGKGSVELANGQQPKKYGESPTAAGGGVNAGKSAAVGGVKRGSELSTAEKQEIQMKKAKLVNMLDEVEQRYRQYHHQMQVVISWFEQASGVGSAKTYTALALQTISKQFRCLKDAILGQVRTASTNLGEEDALGGKAEGSRLKYVDNQIRQQRALQQLGMIQHNAWRPQRGLPEQSVTVLRSWLFEHFLHPYPKDSDKVILAKQTGLTRSQVSNWFINARVRLWKPMVEEMYMEEVKGVERIGSEDKNSPSTEQPQDSILKSTAPQAKSPIPENHNNAGFDLIGPAEMDSITQGTAKKQCKINADVSHSLPSTTNINLTPMSNEDNDHMSMKFKLMGGPANFIGGFGSYPIAELERYETEQFQAPYSGSNGVSLTLGLPRMGGGSHPNFLPTSDFSGMNTPTSDRSDNVYENIDIQNRKRFAAELMPDFVA